MPSNRQPFIVSRRTYLATKLMAQTDCGIFTAIEAVSSTAIEHPEWDMDEKKRWIDWEKEYGT